MTATEAYTYPAADILALPLDTGALRATADLPASLTGAELAVSDFALTRGKDGSLYVAGGLAASGNVVSLKTIGKWTSGKGWISQSTSGDIPVGRVGASLVAHPSLDLLILHGGAVNQAATPTLAFLNTTSWAWSTPSNLQPPASNAAAYHTAVMTPQGVMITAFGLGSSGSPSSGVFFLDMRATAPSSWTWKSYWNKDMLEATSPTFTNTSTTAGIVAPQNSDNDSTSKKTTSIVVPVVIAAVVFISLAIFFVRRKFRMDRKRRQARHFSFSSQEDDGDFRNAIDRFNSAPRQTNTQYGFGKDANEREGNVFSDMLGAFKRLSRQPSIDSINAAGPKEMVQVGDGRPSKAMNWEEIDFGLGGLDERSRQNSFADPVPAVDPFADPAPLIRLDSRNSDLAMPLDDGQQPLIPELHIVPPTVPPTPASVMSDQAFVPSETDGLDWNMLAEEMQVRPAFRSISPNSTLRSHAHASTPAPIDPVRASPADLELPYLRSASPAPIYVPDAPAPGFDLLPLADPFRLSGAPRIPSIDFENGGVAPLPSKRRTSDLAQLGIRSVPQSVGRQLTGRRDSAPMTGSPSRPVSMHIPEMLPARRDSAPFAGSNARPVSMHATGIMPTVRRASTPALFSSPGTPNTFGGRRSSGSPIAAKEKRESAMSKLRVMNMTDGDSLES